MAIPAAYQGREQSFLKHEVLSQYLRKWGHKLGSSGRFHGLTLWYVDCFAGPWFSSSDDLQDTSVHLGLKALEEAGETWRTKGADVQLRAIFVEKDRSAFKRLEEYLGSRKGSVVTVPLFGEFGEHVQEINRLIGRSNAFLFVDPKGWKGAAMHYIEPLAKKPGRDMLINVMTSHIQRWENYKAGWLVRQFQEFFGLEDQEIPRLADDSTLMAFYRKQLKAKCGVRFAADLAIPNPNRRGTHFRLVVGGHSPEVLRVFRDVEDKVLGQFGGKVLEEAKRNRTPQMSWLPVEEGPSQEYADEHQSGLDDLPNAIAEAIEARGGRMRFGDLWPELLEAHHLRYKDVTDCLIKMRGVVELEGLAPRKRTPQDTTFIRLKTPESEATAGASEPRGGPRASRDDLEAPLLSRRAANSTSHLAQQETPWKKS